VNWPVVIAVSLTWLMGLMGYVRASVRTHWHVYGVMQDTSVDAFTPTIGFAAKVTSVTVLIFFALVGVVFWLSSLSGAKAPVSVGSKERRP
jgi:cytochrome d ubiquinol oxidase subunit I